MTSFTFIERVVIPAVIAIALAGGIAGLVLGCALVMNHAVSTRETFAPLEAPISVEPAVGAEGRRPLLGGFLVVAGILAVYFLIVRLDFRAHYAPGVDVTRLLGSSIALE